MNPQRFLYTNLNRARLPVSPLGHLFSFNFHCTDLTVVAKCTFVPSQKTIINRFSRQSATRTPIFIICLFYFLKKFIRNKLRIFIFFVCRNQKSWFAIFCFCNRNNSSNITNRKFFNPCFKFYIRNFFAI